MRLSIQILAVAIIILGAGLLGYAGLTTGQTWGDDFAAYLQQASSIVDGSLATNLQQNAFTIDHSTVVIGPVAYPWGTPIMLAPLWAAYGLNIFALKGLNLALFLLSLAALAAAFHSRVRFPSLLLILALVGLNPVLLSGLNEVGSDIPFLFISSLALCWMTWVIMDRRRILGPRADRIFLGVLLAAALFVRETGILLAISALIADLLCSDWWRLRAAALMDRLRRTPARNPVPPPAGSAVRPALTLLPYFVLLLLAAVWYAVFPGGESTYLKSLQAVNLAGIQSNLSYYFRLPAEFLASIPRTKNVYDLALVFLLAGVVLRFRRDLPIVLFFVFTLLTYVLWPFQQGPRFLFPLLPFFFYFTLAGMEGLARAIPGLWRNRAAVAGYAALLLMAFFPVRQSVRAAVDNLQNNRASDVGPFTPMAQAFFAYVEQNVPAQSVVVFFKPRALRLFTGRQSFQADTPAGLTGGDYLCFFSGAGAENQINEDDLHSLVDAGSLQPVFQNGEFQLYRIPDSNRGAS